MYMGLESLTLVTMIPGELGYAVGGGLASALVAVWKRSNVDRDRFLKREEARDAREDAHRTLVVHALEKVADEFHEVQLAIKDATRAG